MAEVVLDLKEFLNWTEEKKLILAEELRKEIMRVMEVEGLFKTGWTIGHLQAYTEGDYIVVEGPGVPLFYLEWGTTAHMVRPRKMKALHWKEGGQNYFSKGHMVSGIPAYAPFRRGTDAFLASLHTKLK